MDRKDVILSEIEESIRLLGHTVPLTGDELKSYLHLVSAFETFKDSTGVENG